MSDRDIESQEVRETADLRAALSFDQFETNLNMNDMDQGGGEGEEGGLGGGSQANSAASLSGSRPGSVRSAIPSDSLVVEHPSTAPAVTPLSRTASAGSIPGMAPKSNPPAKKEPELPDNSDLALQHVHSNGLIDQTNYLPRKQVLTIFAALTMAILLSFLDQTIISTALPQISAAFNQGRSAAWVSSAYLMTSTAVQPSWGQMSDIFGRKIILMLCIVIFLLGSLLCAVAQSMIQLIIFRAIQGVGGGAINVIVFLITSDIVPLHDRGRYQGIIEGVIALSNGIGPILGGVLTEKTTWRWCFWINLPCGGLTLVVLFVFLPLARLRGGAREKLAKIDYVGSAIIIGASTMIILALNWGGVSFPWVSGHVLGCLIGGFAVFVLLAVWEKYGARTPVVPTGIFQTANICTIYMLAFVAGMVHICQMYYLPQYLQVARGYSPIASGVLTLPLLIVIPFVVASTGQLIARIYVYKYNICAGFSLWAVCLGVISTMDETTPRAQFIGILVLMAFGTGQTLQTTMVAAQASVSRSNMSPVTAFRNFLRTMGGAFGLSIAQAIVNACFKSRLGPNPLFTSQLIEDIIDAPTSLKRANVHTPASILAMTDTQRSDAIAAYIKGFQSMFILYASLTAFCALLAIIFMKNNNLKKREEDFLRQKALAEGSGEKPEEGKTDGQDTGNEGRAKGEDELKITEKNLATAVSKTDTNTIARAHADATSTHATTEKSGKVRRFMRFTKK